MTQAQRPRQARLPYRPDTLAVFERLQGMLWPVWLDSGWPAGLAGRYDLIAADPSVQLLSRGGRVELAYRDRRSETRAGRDALSILRDLLGPRRHDFPQFPFGPGAIGYIGYEYGLPLARVDASAGAAELPELAMGIYDWVVLVDHLAKRSWLLAAGRDEQTSAMWEVLLERLSDSAAVTTPATPGSLWGLRSNLDPERYRVAFRRVQHYIREGDCYQVNLAQRFRGTYQGQPLQTYRTLRELNPAPYGAYLGLPFASVLSISPELFLQLRGGRIVTRPIKGTRQRVGGRDDADARALRDSPKDRAENLMIVDLLRNDLGRVCRPGTVQVPMLFNVESHPSVHHLVSEVRGELAGGHDAVDLLRACFPGGSITGAPKRRAMQIIQELEPDRREVYCGAIGWLGRNGDASFNIAIRTLLLDANGQASYWAGGGIVSDSVCEAEYQESLDKAAAFFRLFEVAGG